jgi:apolipoprotein D and lipocalin family protein
VKFSQWLDERSLIVEFFWPFKGDYWILTLDDDYQYAMVGHPSKK